MKDKSDTLKQVYFRKAEATDLDLLQSWDQQAHVIASDPDSDWNWAYELKRTPAWREQLIAMFEETPIGMVQIIDPFLEETHYWGEVEMNLRAIDIWIGPPEYLNRGLGTQMIKMAIERCFAKQAVKAIIIDPLVSNTAAHRFYERLGFRQMERRFFANDECFVYRLDRADYFLS